MTPHFHLAAMRGFFALDPFAFGLNLHCLRLQAFDKFALHFGFPARSKLALELCGFLFRSNIPKACCFSNRFELLTCLGLAARRLLELRLYLQARLELALRISFETGGELTLCLGFLQGCPLALGGFHLALPHGSFQAQRRLPGGGLGGLLPVEQMLRRWLGIRRSLVLNGWRFGRRVFVSRFVSWGVAGRFSGCLAFSLFVVLLVEWDAVFVDVILVVLFFGLIELVQV